MSRAATDASGRVGSVRMLGRGCTDEAMLASVMRTRSGDAWRDAAPSTVHDGIARSERVHTSIVNAHRWCSWRSSAPPTVDHASGLFECMNATVVQALGDRSGRGPAPLTVGHSSFPSSRNEPGLPPSSKRNLRKTVPLQMHSELLIVTPDAVSRRSHFGLSGLSPYWPAAYFVCRIRFKLCSRRIEL